MKKFIYPAFIVGAVVVTIASMMNGGLVLAQTVSSSTVKNVSILRQVAVASGGRATLSGVVVSASSTSAITVNSWGGDWTVNLAGSTRIMRTGAGRISAGEIKSGDRVTIVGRALADQMLVINATSLLDRSVQRMTYTGTISNVDVSAGTFTLTTPARVIVNIEGPVTGSAKVSGSGITSISGLADGMSVRVIGDLNRSEGVVYAATIVVRSIPVGASPMVVQPPTSTSLDSSNTTTNVPSTTVVVPSTTPVTGTPSPMTTPATMAVSISGFAFNPTTSTVSIGTTITWTNNDVVAHTVTADDNSFNSGLIQPGATYSKTFSSAATIPYHCTVHPTMHGAVIVQ